MSHILSGLAAIFGLPESKFRPHARDVGGGFGIRSDAYPEYCAALLAARQLGRPVKWVVVALRDLRQRLPRPRRAAERGARARPRREVPRPPLAVVLNMGAYLSQPGPIINT